MTRNPLNGCIARYGLPKNYLERLNDAIATAGIIVNEK